MNRRLRSILLIGMTALMITGCGGNNKNNTTAGTVAKETVSEETPAGEMPDTEAGKTETNNIGTIDGVDFEGNEVSNAVLDGFDVTMINVWATFCDPCLREMPDLSEIHKSYADQDKKFQIIGICTDTVGLTGTDEKILAYAKEIESTLELSYLNIVPGDMLMIDGLKDIYAVPTTIFVDADGNILETVVGSKSKADWEKIISKHYQE